MKCMWIKKHSQFLNHENVNKYSWLLGNECDDLRNTLDFLIIWM